MKKCKIFDFDICKAMLLGDEKGTNFYMQVGSSDWSFCVGNFEPFEEWDDEEQIRALAKEHFEIVKKSEDLQAEVLEIDNTGGFV